MIYDIFSIIKIISKLGKNNLLFFPLSLSYTYPNKIYLASLSLLVIGLIIEVIFFYKLYNVTSDVFKWVHIDFGYAVFINLASIIFFMSKSLSNTYSMLVVALRFSWILAIKLILWVAIIRHLRKAQKENIMVFS